jgi:hypothetical protein
MRITTNSHTWRYIVLRSFGRNGYLHERRKVLKVLLAGNQQPCYVSLVDDLSILEVLYRRLQQKKV